MKRLIVTALFLAAFAGACFAAKKEQKSDFKICSYVNANWVKEGYDFERLAHVDRIYVFGLSPDEEGSFVVTDKYRRGLEAILAASKNGQQKLLTVGGGATVKQMFVMGTDPEKRAAYAKELVRLSEEYSFDGIDVDWEASRKAGGVYTDEQFTDFLKEIKALQKPGQLLTATLSRRRECARLAVKAIEYVDDISVMIYSHIEKKDRSLAPLWVVEEVMGWYAEAGVPADRLIPGVPFYGIHQSMADGKPRKNRTYAVIEPTLPKGDRKINVDADGYAFNSYDEMKDKTIWMRSKGYKGIMIWELSQDAPYDCGRSLLRAINDGVVAKQKPIKPQKKEKPVKEPVQKGPLTLSLEMSDGTALIYPFDSTAKNQIGNSFGKAPVNTGITEFTFSKDGDTYVLKAKASTDIAMNTVRGIRVGSEIGDYIEVPAIEGKRITGIVLTGGYRGSGVPQICDENGNLVSGGERHSFAEAGEEFSWSFGDTKPGLPLRITSTVARELNFRKITVKYE